MEIAVLVNEQHVGGAVQDVFVQDALAKNVTLAGVEIIVPVHGQHRVDRFGQKAAGHGHAGVESPGGHGPQLGGGGDDDVGHPPVAVAVAAAGNGHRNGRILIKGFAVKITWVQFAPAGKIDGQGVYVLHDVRLSGAGQTEALAESAVEKQRQRCEKGEYAGKDTAGRR